MGARLAVDQQSERSRPRLLPLVVAASVMIAAALLMITGGPTGVDDGQSGDPAPIEAAGLTDTRDQQPYETLGRPTGVSAIVLTATHLELIDMDTAAREIVPLPDEIEIDSIDVGRRLLLQNGSLLIPNGSVVWSLDLATGVITDVGAGERVAPALTNGHAWIFEAETTTWHETDSTGQTVRSVPWPENALPWDHGSGTPEISWLATGGIYRLQPTGAWTRIADGVPVAASDTAALLNTCQTLDHCTLRWISTDTGVELDRKISLAFQQTGFRSYRLSPSGAAVLEMNPTDEPYRSVFVFQNGIVRGTSCADGWRSGTWSADETLLACVTKKGVAVTDVMNGPVAAFEDWDSSPLGIVLVENAALGW